MDPKTVEALRILANVLAGEQRKFVLIGATVPQIVLDFRDIPGSGSRETRDVDAVAEVDSWEDFARLRERLLREGFCPGRVAHEFWFDDEVRMDLIPFGPALVEEDKLAWPYGDSVMTACGFAEALDCARPEQITSDFTVLVVTIPGLVLTKVIAYMDRPEERARDLIDILYCFDRYEATGRESRRFDRAGTEVDGEAVTFEEAGAFLLGMAVAALAKPKSLEIVRRFLSMFPDGFARPVSQIVSEEKRLVDNEKRRGVLYRLFRVFGAGINQTGDM
jgi:predicted nucleotidyltransferase